VLLRGVSWFSTDVSGPTVCPIFKGKLSEILKACPLKMGPIGGPETSVLNHLTPRNNSEDGPTQVIKTRRNTVFIMRCVVL
jgi:hypothetical protein